MTVDEYLAQVKPSQREALERVRAIIRRLVPDADETISYGMPVFTYKKQRLIYYAAFKHHMSIFPGTIRFTEDQPVAESVLQDIITRRISQITMR